MRKWKKVSFNDYYEISNSGILRSVSRTVEDKNGKLIQKQGQIIKPYKINSGYLVGRLSRNSKSVSSLIHRLVAEAFVPNPENKPCVNHKNGNKMDNRASNLEWVTEVENMRHAVDNGFCDEAAKKAAKRMKKIGKKYSKINAKRLSTYPRNEKGWIVKPKT